jgi:hypothetical protein
MGRLVLRYQLAIRAAVKQVAHGRVQGCAPLNRTPGGIGDHCHCIVDRNHMPNAFYREGRHGIVCDQPAAKDWAACDHYGMADAAIGVARLDSPVQLAEP